MPAAGIDHKVFHTTSKAWKLQRRTTKLSSGGAAEPQGLESRYAPPSAAAPCSAATRIRARHALPRFKTHCPELTVIRSYFKRLLDQPVDLPNGYMRGVRPLPLWLREVHKDDLQVTCVIDIVRNVLVEIKLDR